MHANEKLSERLEELSKATLSHWCEPLVLTRASHRRLMQTMVGASSNIALGGADSFEQPDGPQHTTSQGCATHGCFDIDKSSLTGCMQGRRQTGLPRTLARDSKTLFRLGSKQKFMAGEIALLWVYK